MVRTVILGMLAVSALMGNCGDDMKVRETVFCIAMVTGHLYGQVNGGEVHSLGIGVYNPTESGHGTVSVGIATSEGIVLAADSRMTTNTRVISDYASKLFDVGHIGIAIYGQAFLDNRNIASWIADFRPTHQAEDVEEIARDLTAFIAVPYDAQFPQGAAVRPPLGFFIGGYDAHRVGRLIQVEFPNARQANTVFTTQRPGAQWGGNTDVITRLILGFDPRLGDLPIFSTLTPEQMATVRPQLTQLQYNIPFDALTLQDGIDLALSLVRTTVEMQRFADGTIGHPGQIPSVGGAVDVLVVMPSELRWIRRKELRAQ